MSPVVASLRLTIPSSLALVGGGAPLNVTFPDTVTAGTSRAVLSPRKLVGASRRWARSLTGTAVPVVRP